MLLFNTLAYSIIGLQEHFNTSNVTIQHLLPTAAQPVQLDFNTSNVTIQRLELVSSYSSEAYFNTSNVTIQPISVPARGTLIVFQYI